MAESKSAIVKLASRLQRSENREKKNREASEQTLMRGVHGFEALAGGALGGLADGLAGGPTGELSVLSVPVVPVVGIALAGTSLIGYPGAAHVGSVAIGAASYWLGKFVREAM